MSGAPRGLLTVGVLIVVTLAQVTGAATAQRSPSLTTLRVQKSLIVNINKTTGYATAAGYIKVAGKRVATKAPSYTVTRSDSLGYTCGATEIGTGSKLKLAAPGAFRVTVTLSSQNKYGNNYLTASKTVTADLGSDLVRCAPMPNAPVPATQLCVSGIDDPTRPCGVAVANSPVLVTRPRLTVDGAFVVVHASEIGSNGGCTLAQAKGIPSSRPWLGGQVTLGWYRCADGSLLIPAINAAYSSAGATQINLKLPYDGYGAFAASFEFPAHCGGDLEVTFGIQTELPNRGVVGGESSNAQLKLPGKDDCSALVSGG